VAVQVVFSIIRAGNGRFHLLALAIPMKLWPLFSLLLLAQQSVLLGLGALTVSPQGDDALAAGLWEIAELHYKERLADPSLSSDARSQILLRLAESLIRSGNPSEALGLLDQSWVARNPETRFWKAQALAGQNHFSEAAELFATLLEDPAALYRIEAGFTRASLLLTLEQPQAALETLAKLIPEADAATRVKIRLYQTEILLDLKRTVEARQAMPEVQAVAASDRPLAKFLHAQLILKEGNPLDAETAFQALINHPQGQSLTRYHAAAIGLADSIQARGDPQAATQSLIDFLQDQSDSPLLDEIFTRILQWLPEKPSTTDPSLERIAQWITPPALPAIGPIATTPSTGADAAWPSYTEPNDLSDLQAYSLYTRAVGRHHMGSPESQAEARHLLTRLRVEYPKHLLANRALYQQARWLLDEGSVDQAFSLLETLRDTTKSPILKGEAAFLAARVAYLNGDPKQAIQLFEEAALALTGTAARFARLQAAIARLRSGNLKGATLIQQLGTPPDKALEEDLELERALSTTSPSTARSALEEFIRRFPNHPRTPEARLAAAEAALADSPPDLPFARYQLDCISAAAENSTAPPAPRMALARLHLADLSRDSAATIVAAQTIIDHYPADPVAAEAALTLGRNLFQTGSYNPARLVLEKLAASDSNPTRAQVAWLLAARAAALGGTPQSKDEALALFDKAIVAKGPVSSIASLEKARHLIDMYRLAEASEFLGKWLKILPDTDPLKLPAGLLLGEALYAQGSSNPASLVEALAVYDKLLAHAKNQPALLNRLQYLRGTTLEQVPDDKDPTKKREKQAFLAYHSVLETTTPPLEWEYFERCGFRALALLEKAERWPVAITVAKKIASYKGPRAEEAATRASQLQLKHMIWED
jgi:outer membrane protein assembly factor BamD (BamD/ComL family)